MKEYAVVVGTLVVGGKTIANKAPVKLEDEVAEDLVEKGIIVELKTEGKAEAEVKDKDEDEDEDENIDDLLGDDKAKPVKKVAKKGK